MAVDQEFVLLSFRQPEMVEWYATDVDRYGLWESERIMFERYVQPNARILEIGCGAGRATFGLYSLGYVGISAIDLSDGMIAAARTRAKATDVALSFEVGDATALRFDSMSFDVVFFWYNGLMTIPTRAARERAFDEIRRVLVPNGLFLFTTHDRSFPSVWDQFWIDEARRWAEGSQDLRVPEFGDRIIDHHGHETFVHFPDRKEILTALAAAGFEHVEDVMRSELAVESVELVKNTGDCRFWVARVI